MPLTFDEKRHVYTLDGVELPSVTTITRFCAVDYVSSRPWLADSAARRGTAIHEACALIDYGEEPEPDPEIDGYLKAYRRFLADFSPAWDRIECPAASLDLGFAGTPDRVGSIDGEPAVLDIKSGQLHIVALAAQLTAYALLLGYGQAAVWPALYGLKLASDGTYVLKRVAPAPDVFEACRTLYKRLERKKHK